MKTKILMVAFTLVMTSALNAQMMANKNNVDDYLKCVNGCQALRNSGDIAICTEGCKAIIRCPNDRTVSGAKDLTPVINAAITKTKIGRSLIYADQAYQYFVAFGNGKITAYQIKSRENGNEGPFPVVTFGSGSTKSYFIFDVDGKYLKVKKPDGIQILEIAGKANQ